VSAPIRIRRVYDPPRRDDGMRILVDRLWPRGLRKADAAVDLWMREVAPSTELRRWFAHDPARWEEFRTRYRDELAREPEALAVLLDHCRKGAVTLLFGARDSEHNQAVVLRKVLAEELAEEERADDPSSPVCYFEPDEKRDR
jgi:uncharacterized protein YeaO (DUF488 family)